MKKLPVINKIFIYFLGPTGPGVAGYLTAGTRSTMPDQPPPVDKHERTNSLLD